MEKMRVPFFVVFAVSMSAKADVTLKLTNTLPFERGNETIELTAKDLPGIQAKQFSSVHVKDENGAEPICQAIHDVPTGVGGAGGAAEPMVIFQTDFAPNQSKTFTVSVGKHWIYSTDQYKAYGRFVRERFDDFAWENDRIAHRTYGKALETAAGGPPMVSSAIDIWSKRVPQLVINEWYMTEHYHSDMGQGYDDYSAGTTRGCGGTGIWSDGKLVVGHNFIDSHVIAQGPIRVSFELTYPPMDVDGMHITETKHITLDAGQNLDHFVSTYAGIDSGKDEICGAGLRKMEGDKKEFNAERGYLVKEEPMEKNGGTQGIALIADPAEIDKQAEDAKNDLVLLKIPQDTHAVSYWAGFYWDKSGQFKDYDAWKEYVDHAAQGVKAPIQIEVQK